MSQITTHVLDVSRGKPASSISVLLELQTANGSWKELGKGTTDSDGRLKNLLEPGKLETGTYRLTFDTAAYFAERKIESLYPKVDIVFEVRNAREHYHIPLLLSPFGYSTYRGS
jgi:5-hydroxyisourate hydrolase